MCITTAAWELQLAEQMQKVDEHIRDKCYVFEVTDEVEELNYGEDEEVVRVESQDRPNRQSEEVRKLAPEHGVRDIKASADPRMPSRKEAGPQAHAPAAPELVPDLRPGEMGATWAIARELRANEG